jgi:hypothetical protein
VEHDMLVCGLPGFDAPPPCSSCAAEGNLANGFRPGPQPCNRVAGTPEEQIRRALGRRGKNRTLVRLIRRVVHRMLVRELPEAVSELVRQEMGRKKVRK